MILVTGGTGLVGSHLLFKLIQQGEKIVAIHRHNSNLNAVKRVFSYYSKNPEALFSSIKWIEADITDVPALSKCFNDITNVYHCAALISFSTADYKNLRKINIEGTANVVNMCISNHVKKLCFVSSVAAVGKPLIGRDINEENEWNVSDNNYGYAITKFGAETEVWRASQEGIDVVIVNPGVILGPGFWNTGPGTIFDKIYKGFPFYTEGITGFVDINDVINIMVCLMQSSIKTQRYILVGQNESFKNVFFAIAEAFHKKNPSIKVTKVISAIGWRLSWLISKLSGKRPMITKQSANSAHNSYSYCSKKLTEAIDFKFTDLDETIKNTCNFYLQDVKSSN